MGPSFAVVAAWQRCQAVGSNAVRMQSATLAVYRRPLGLPNRGHWHLPATQVVVGPTGELPLQDSLRTAE